MKLKTTLRNTSGALSALSLVMMSVPAFGLQRLHLIRYTATVRSGV
jgi:hypothetical protein